MYVCVYFYMIYYVYLYNIYSLHIITYTFKIKVNKIYIKVKTLSLSTVSFRDIMMGGRAGNITVQGKESEVERRPVAEEGPVGRIETGSP